MKYLENYRATNNLSQAHSVEIYGSSIHTCITIDTLPISGDNVQQFPESSTHITISRKRLLELEYLENNIDTILHISAMEYIVSQTNQNAIQVRLKRETKKQAHAEIIHQKMELYFDNIMKGDIISVGNYLNNDGVISVRNCEGETSLHVSVRIEQSDMVEYLLEHPQLLMNPNIVNAMNPSGQTPLHIACQLKNIELVNQLLESNADPNILNHEGYTPLHYAVLANSIEIVTVLLKSRADILLKNSEGQYALDLAASFDIKLLLQNQRKHMRVWCGWSKEDVGQMDTIFTEHADKYSYCPICLKFVERDEGCIYVSHNCAAEGRTHHSKLFSAYVNKHPENDTECIQWCSICNRIASKNRHYSRSPYDTDASLVQPGNIYETDCQLSNSGGGLLEKYIRFMGLRKSIHTLNDSVSEISEMNAISELVEQMWNAPFLHKISKIVSWKLKLSQFPLRSELPTHEPSAPISIERPEEDKYLLPVLHESGKNSISIDKRCKVIQFIHRTRDGMINEHTNRYISLTTLVHFIELVVRDYTTGLDCQSLGYCWNRGEGCTAVLYPEEIRHALVALNWNENEQVLFAEYERLFAKKITNGMTVR